MFPGPAAFGPPPGAPPQPWSGPVPPAAGRPPLTGARLAVLVGLVSAVVAALVTSLVFVAAGSPRSSQPAASAAPGAVPDVAGILDETEASVVSVHTGEGDPSALFGGAGTGVIISDDGLVLTNAHVVNATGGITLTLADGTEVQAELVGSMPDDDVALVQIVNPPADLRAATLGSSDALAVGDAVVAIGNALNLGGRPTVTTGILSAKDRTIQAPNLTLRNLLQTDAAINPGNSGGPLLNAAGEVVGINTAIISDAQNIGFAIPIDKVRPLIDDIRDGKATITLDTAFLGVSSTSVADTSSATLEEYSVDATTGAFVQEVQDGSPAAAADLRVGDVIVAVDDEPTATSSDVVAAIREHQPGDTITITVERRGERLDLEATVGSRRDLQSSTSTTEPGG